MQYKLSLKTSKTFYTCLGVHPLSFISLVVLLATLRLVRHSTPVLVFAHCLYIFSSPLGHTQTTSLLSNHLTHLCLYFHLVETYVFIMFVCHKFVL